MYSGSCLCGKVKFTINGKIKDIVYCHCSLCRKAQGSAYATNGNVDSKHFRFISGEKDLTAYQASTDSTKYFCKHCGSPILSRSTSFPNKIRIRLGTVESKITERPEAHIFATSKACWDSIEDDLPQFEAYLPEH